MTTTEDIEDAILSTAADSREHRAECDAFLPRIAAVWADVSPEHTGRYKHSIHTEDRPAPLTKLACVVANRSAASTTKPGRPLRRDGTGDPLGHYSRASQCWARTTDVR